MLNEMTNPLLRFTRTVKENSWNKQPKEMTEDKIPVKLSEIPSSFVKEARNEPVTKREIRYSSAASIKYITRLRFIAASETEFIDVFPLKQHFTFEHP